MSLFTSKRIFGSDYPSHPMFYFIGGFVSIAEGVVLIITFGLVHVGWISRFYSWLIDKRVKYSIYRKFKEEQK